MVVNETKYCRKPSARDNLTHGKLPLLLPNYKHFLR